MLWKCCTQYASKFGKTQQWPQDWKRSVFIPIPKKGNVKECSNYRKIVLISHASKVMLKILRTRLQQYMNWKLPDVRAGFRKGGGTRDQVANIPRIIENTKEFQKKTLLCFIEYAKNFDLHTGFSRSRSGGLVFPSLEESSSLLWSTQSKALA